MALASGKSHGQQRLPSNSADPCLRGDRELSSETADKEVEMQGKEFEMA